MVLLAREDILAYLDSDDEIPGAIRWAEYYGFEHTWDQERLLLTVSLKGGNTREGEQEPYLLAGTFEDYRVMPPAWGCLARC